MTANQHREERIYSKEPVRIGDHDFVVEYLHDFIAIPGGVMREMLAVVREHGQTVFTIKQTSTMVPPRGGVTPRENGLDVILQRDVDRRLRTGDWEPDADYELPPLE